MEFQDNEKVLFVMQTSMLLNISCLNLKHCTVQSICATVTEQQDNAFITLNIFGGIMLQK